MQVRKAKKRFFEVVAIEDPELPLEMPETKLTWAQKQAIDFLTSVMVQALKKETVQKGALLPHGKEVGKSKGASSAGET
ncbi:MAG: hypothetical protein QHH75_11995 [Bacillota bacterium]|nr:hypothetical protein [Bacillota bacterium]